ncbi:two-component regulator propeller domain-containing protein [Melioribacteraceae bacterium 4301-Me]|uniref:ligand-binding sensor domain-containing protein n=1 Tax=Pyranulibacter aquaticus TaxID=3163344 RepID=UPI003598E96C
MKNNQLLLAFILNVCTLAQQSNQEYTFRQLRMEDGLSQSTAFCMIQDKKGYLWIGTANGLNRYDGYSFKVYYNDPLDSNSISDNGIFSLYEDKDGNIWIGTIMGYLNKFERKKEIFKKIKLFDNLANDNPCKSYEFPFPFSRNNEKSIMSIAEDKQGYLWIATWGMGLIRYDKKKNEILRFHKNDNNNRHITSNRIKSVVVDSYGNIWAGSLGGGLVRITPKENNSFHKVMNSYDIAQFSFSPINKNSLSSNNITCLSLDNNGNLLIGTYGGGFNILNKSELNKNKEEIHFVNYTNKPNNLNSLSSNIVMAIIQDHLNYYWVGTFEGGLDRLDLKTHNYTNFKNNPTMPNSLSKNDILSLFEDRSGNIWVGTHLGKGINKIERNLVKFNRLSRAAQKNVGLNDEVVWAIYPDKDSILWIGTYKGGLNCFDRKNLHFTYYIHKADDPFSISDNHIRAIADDGMGNLWIGTYDKGLNKFNKKTKQFQHYFHSDKDTTSLSSNQIQAVYIDSSKTFWIGTFGGGLNYFKYNPHQNGRIAFKKYLHNPNDQFSISDNRIYCIYEDKEGILWIGTFGGGLNKFNKETQKFFPYKNIPSDINSLSDNRVISIYEDENNFLWVGTFGGGLNKFDKKTEKFVRYNQKHRINSTVTYGILEDDKNNLWLSTDNGLFKLNTVTNKFIQYDLHDGIQSMEFNGGAFAKSTSGEMFFGGINGLNYFYPDSIKDNQYIPPVVISKIRIFNEPITGEPDTLILEFNQNFFSFEFAALDFTYPPDNLYAYKLEGFDMDWHYVNSKNRMANYTNLSPGKYIFKVKGSNNDGLWNMEGTNLYIIISPPFWQRWWFITVLTIVIGLTVYYLSTIRFRALLSIEKLKTKLAADIHDNIGAGLTEISILSEIATSKIKLSSEVTNELKLISEKSRLLIDNMSDIVWIINPMKDSLYDLILKLKDTYSDLLNTMGISFGTTYVEKLASIKLPIEYKQNLFLIFKEAINNSIKYSKCKKILLEAKINNDELQITLSDDGVGIDFNSIKKGNGLINMKSRAEKIQGRLTINSKLGAGTEIKFSSKVNFINRLKKLIVREL